MPDYFIVLPVTLFETLPDISHGTKIVIVEHPVYFGNIDGEIFHFSKAKLTYTKATLLAYHEHLKSKSIRFEHISVEEYESWKKTIHASHLSFYDPVDKTVVADLQRAAKAVTVIEAPNFITSSADMAEYHDRKPNKRWFHKHFYEWQRKRTGILMHNNKPVGEKYSFDTSNRRPLPKGHVSPKPPALRQDDLNHWQRASDWVETHFPRAPSLSNRQQLMFPVTFAGARIWLKNFLDARLSLFGLYEDAIAMSQPLLYHSGCSPMLLVGLLTPQQILRELFRRRNAPIEAVEGYVRQLIGWREYCRITYVYESESLFRANFLGSDRRLKACWYNGTTGISPVDDAIKDAFSHGYLHHIRRLMLVGGLMLITGVHPHDIFRWFLEFAVDSNVMIMCFNTLDMVGFATGGLTTTKPYCSGSNYVQKMSDYPPGPWCDTWNSLYYQFWKKHRTKLSNVRQGMFAIGNLKRKNVQEHKQIKRIADEFIRRTTH